MYLPLQWDDSFMHRWKDSLASHYRALPSLLCASSPSSPSTIMASSCSHRSSWPLQVPISHHGLFMSSLVIMASSCPHWSSWHLRVPIDHHGLFVSPLAIMASSCPHQSSRHLHVLHAHVPTVLRCFISLEKGIRRHSSQTNMFSFSTNFWVLSKGTLKVTFWFGPRNKGNLTENISKRARFLKYPYYLLQRNLFQPWGRGQWEKCARHSWVPQ